MKEKEGEEERDDFLSRRDMLKRLGHYSTIAAAVLVVGSSTTAVSGCGEDEPSPDWTNTQWENTQWENTQWENTQWENTPWSNTSWNDGWVNYWGNWMQSW